ncbi:hypothetical protein GCM10020256_02430 [Streptomyces thermocoprophilus]
MRAPDVHEAGQVRRETLGFPAWALVNDPANGHHALALVKDVERLARQAKSRPGTAKEGFEELGGRLGRAVPHFLPTFYEQAARVFLQHDNTTYAAVFFGKAREAERVHALTVDEERHRAVFLEFAFAGALTVKALKQHVRDLSARLSPAEAWAQYRQLVVERCAAGMPPYAALPQDARALIKAAGLDRQTEECALVAELLASPAAVRAPRLLLEPLPARPRRPHPRAARRARPAAGDHARRPGPFHRRRRVLADSAERHRRRPPADRGDPPTAASTRPTGSAAGHCTASTARPPAAAPRPPSPSSPV